MNLLAALAGGIVAGGIVLLITYFRPAPAKPPKPKKPSLTTRWKRLGKTTRVNFVIGLVLGVLAAAITGFPVMVLLGPTAMIGLPVLLGKPSIHERDLVLGLETWARSLASTSETGAFTLREVITITQGSAPPILQKPVNRLVARMSTTWSTADALHAFADDLDNIYSDEVVIYLIQAAEFNAGGLSTALTGVADNLSSQAKQKLETEAELAKPRQTMITMTAIMGLALAWILLSASSPQMQFFRTPVGAIALTIVLGVFLLLMIWAKALARPVVLPRILQRGELS
ncbi:MULTISPECIES: type II secretion system F family protein [unclassified Microbacterium]|uniref:type II secretion system F family protein n=1 Tax=unclassified Microbacterium TaxID=2609290 RepID=UPI003015BEF4